MSIDRYYWLRSSAELRPKPQKSPRLIDMIILRDMNQTRLDDELGDGCGDKIWEHPWSSVVHFDVIDR